MKFLHRRADFPSIKFHPEPSQLALIYSVTRLTELPLCRSLHMIPLLSLIPDADLTLRHNGLCLIAGAAR